MKVDPSEEKKIRDIAKYLNEEVVNLSSKYQGSVDTQDIFVMILMKVLTKESPPLRSEEFLSKLDRISKLLS